MSAFEVDGHDVEKVWVSAGEAIQNMREQKKPMFMLSKCAHFEGHMLGDPLLRIVRHPFQRGKEISSGLFSAVLSTSGTSREDRLKRIANITALLKISAAGQKKKGNDPLYLARQKLRKDRAQLDRIEKDVSEEISGAVKTALHTKDGGGN